jgi:hypothetical protein
VRLTSEYNIYTKELRYICDNMSLQAAYKQYLAAPNSSFLADNATLHYVTTLTTVHGPTEIIKHLNSQSKKLKKEEETIDIVEGNNAIVAEVKTTLEFLTGGGAYLPGIDDNFLSDRVVTFPVVSVYFRTPSNHSMLMCICTDPYCSV